MAHARTLFILWDTNDPAHDYLHRELEEASRSNFPMKLLTISKPLDSSLGTETVSLFEDSSSVSGFAAMLRDALVYALRRPDRFMDTLRGFWHLPHRSAAHRFRSVALTFAAAAKVSWIERAGIEYVHAEYGSAPALLAMAISRLAQIPYGVSFHAADIWGDQNLLEEKVGGASLVLTCTAHNARHLRELAGEHPEKVHVAYHGLDLTRLPSPQPLPLASKDTWIAVGHLVPKKGFEHLLRAAAILRDKGDDFHLKIIGEGPERLRLESIIDELELDAFVTLAGELSQEEVWREILKSHALVAPAIRDKAGDLDGIPKGILEAMALGRPVVASDLSGIPEVVASGDTGQLVDPEDGEALARGMAELASDWHLAEKMGRRARKIIEERFDVKKTVPEQLARFPLAR